MRYGVNVKFQQVGLSQIPKTFLKLIYEPCKYSESQVLLNIPLLFINQTNYTYTFKLKV